MPQLDNEQKKGLLLSSIDDEDEEQDASEHLPMTGASRKKTFDNDDQFPVVKKRPKTYQRHRTNFNHPVSFFFILLSAFLFGCLAGVVIMLYRMSQDAQLVNDPSIWMRVDATMKNKLLKSISKDNFLSWNRTVESDLDAANRLETQWKSLPTVFSRVEKFSSDLTLSKPSSTGQWSGVVTVVNGDGRELNKVAAVINQEYLPRSSLIKSGTIQANRIYFLNYGRAEDLSELMEKNLIDWSEDQTKVAFMRRRSTLISMTEQVRQAIRYQFSALVLFDDDDEQLTEENPLDPKSRLTLAEEWKRLKSKKDRQALLEGTTNDESEDENPIVVLILSKSNVEKIFTSVQSDAQQWSSPPEHWHERSAVIKLGGVLKKTTLHLSSSTEEIPLQLPNLFGFVRGKVDPEHFLLVSFQLNNKQQEKVIEQILQSYEHQMKSGWQPRRSIVFSAWSGFSYDRHSIRSWMKKNSRLIDANLVAVIDLGQGVMGNSTLNLHGSPLFEQVVQRAADAVISPLKHDHACHKRQMPGMSPSSATAAPSEEHHHHSRRHADEHQHQMAMGAQEESAEGCEQHKLFDEWMRASQNRLKKNQTWNFVQMIDSQSAAALFQLQQGVPALTVEMTEEKFIFNETFYQKRSISSTADRVQPEVLAAYTQFISEIIRQLSDEPLIPFNLTHYADLLDRQAKDFVAHYGPAYRSLNFNFGVPNDMTALITELTSAIRRVQSEIQQTSLDRLDILERFNQKLIQFERLFVMNNDKDSFAQTSKHLLFGPAFGFTNTIVPFPSLSNLLFDVANGFQMELADTSKVRWSKLKEHVQLVQRTLNGFDGLRVPLNH